jgi:protocatechuate 3,4-dioxygenase alpha subunit
MTQFGLTPSQTVGPFFAYALTPGEYQLTPLVGNNLVTEDAEGKPIRIEGRIFDGEGAPVIDAVIEIWQADGNGVYAQPGRTNKKFIGFGRCETKGGVFSFETVMPGAVPGPEDKRPQAPHINVGIFARGLLLRLFTRIYFEGEALNEQDPILNLIPVEARKTLIAKRSVDSSGMPVYQFDIHLQGEKETAFFEG